MAEENSKFEEEQTISQQANENSYSKKMYFLAIFSVVIAAMNVVIVILIHFSVATVGSKLNNIESEFVKKQFLIMYPSDKDSVHIKEQIIGTTPHYQKNHYLLVTDVLTSGKYIQPNQIFVTEDGAFTGDAQFGEVNSNGKKYIINALATMSKLKHGPIARLPKDAFISNSVIVFRK